MAQYKPTVKSLDECLSSRESVRNYEKTPVPEELVLQVIEAGSQAPCARNGEDPHYVVIQNEERVLETEREVRKNVDYFTEYDKEYRDSIRNGEKDVFYNAPVLVLITAKKAPMVDHDCYIAASYMQLKAVDLGLGSCIIGLSEDLKDREFLRGLGIPENHEVYSSLILGYARETPHQKRAKTPKILKWVR